MLKTLFLTALTLLIALGGGAGSVWLALESGVGFSNVTIGGWSAAPRMGTPAADPYSKARFARDADLVLGGGEGLAFVAARDTAGQFLRPECDYLIEGAFPPARFWTLHARDADGDVLAATGTRAPALHSYALLRGQDGRTSISVSRHPAPGNWLATRGTAPFMLQLTLYDTAIASSARIAEVELPQILRTSCDE